MRGSVHDRILRVRRPQPGTILDAVSQAEPVQVRQIPISGVELGLFAVQPTDGLAQTPRISEEVRTLSS